jgi:hypothetical protein
MRAAHLQDMATVESSVSPTVARMRTDPRIRNLTVRLVLARHCATGYSQEWGHDDEARTWAHEATSIQAELATLVKARDSPAGVLPGA